MKHETTVYCIVELLIQLEDPVLARAERDGLIQEVLLRCMTFYKYFSYWSTHAMKVTSVSYRGGRGHPPAVCFPTPRDLSINIVGCDSLVPRPPHVFQRVREKLGRHLVM